MFNNKIVSIQEVDFRKTEVTVRDYRSNELTRANSLEELNALITEAVCEESANATEFFNSYGINGLTFIQMEQFMQQHPVLFDIPAPYRP
ncbi:hypothetical protein CEW46_27515 [Bacillus cereus]|nr:hypothetical protein CEW46_27515 [Bacillus cereus]